MTSGRRAAAITLGALALGSVVGLSAGPQTPPLEVVLRRAAAYLDSYGQTVSGIVGVENYLQEVVADPRVGLPRSTETERRLVSDIVFLSDPREGWIEFRDVRTVNGRAIDQAQKVVEVLSATAVVALAQSGRPIFRRGVELIQIDVSVRDGKRQPVRGLTQADFTVLENGMPRPVQAFTAIDLSRGHGAWTHRLGDRGRTGRRNE